MGRPSEKSGAGHARVLHSDRTSRRVQQVLGSVFAFAGKHTISTGLFAVR
jgi:hypothetical protein